MVANYAGTDNAQACDNIATEIIAGLHIQKKVLAQFFEVTNFAARPKKYDLILTAWFTAGNFYMDDFTFKHMTMLVKN